MLRRSAARLRLPTPTISEEARQVLYQNDWPGNVRELEHCLERALILSRSGVIMPEHVELASGPAPADPLDAFSLEDGLHGAVQKLERRLIERALTAAAGNRTRAAQLLKINRRLLYDKLREHGLEQKLSNEE
jgi:DNA-binding NtrC family response regulator